MSKKTVVIGASENPDRYSNIATERLKRYGHEVVAVGLKSGDINGTTILSGFPEIEKVDTVTLYVGPRNQPYWEEYILGLHPKRIIFNPGTENADFEKKARNMGIECLEACTLVMLSTGQY